MSRKEAMGSSMLSLKNSLSRDFAIRFAFNDHHVEAISIHLYQTRVSQPLTPEPWNTCPLLLSAAVSTNRNDFLPCLYWVAVGTVGFQASWSSRSIRWRDDFPLDTEMLISTQRGPQATAFNLQRSSGSERWLNKGQGEKSVSFWGGNILMLVAP